MVLPWPVLHRRERIMHGTKKPEDQTVMLHRKEDLQIILNSDVLSAQAGEIFDYNTVPLAPLNICNQFLKLRPIECSAAPPCIDVPTRYGKLVFLPSRFNNFLPVFYGIIAALSCDRQMDVPNSL